MRIWWSDVYWNLKVTVTEDRITKCLENIMVGQKNTDMPPSTHLKLNRSLVLVLMMAVLVTVNKVEVESEGSHVWFVLKINTK